MKFAPTPQNAAEKGLGVLVDVKLKHDLAVHPWHSNGWQHTGLP